MPRKIKMKSEDFDLAVGVVFENLKTTAEQRREVATNWCLGDYEHHIKFATERGLLPIAVLVAALLEIDHPLLIEESLPKYRSLLGCAVAVLEVELENKSVHIPLGTTCVHLGTTVKLSTGKELEVVAS